MGHCLTTESLFNTDRASRFRQTVLAGSEILTYAELRALADDLHKRARLRRPRPFAAYPEQRSFKPRTSVSV